MLCPKCGREMVNLGNVSGIIYTSVPPQWDDIHVCHICKVQVKKREREESKPCYDFLKDYEVLHYKLIEETYL